MPADDQPIRPDPPQDVHDNQTVVPAPARTSMRRAVTRTPNPGPEKSRASTSSRSRSSRSA